MKSVLDKHWWPMVLLKGFRDQAIFSLVDSGKGGGEKARGAGTVYVDLQGAVWKTLELAGPGG